MCTRTADFGAPDWSSKAISRDRIEFRTVLFFSLYFDGAYIEVCFYFSFFFDHNQKGEPFVQSVAESDVD